MQFPRWLVCIPLIYLVAIFGFHRQETAVQRADAWGYYLHLPATFIYGDAGDYTQSIEHWHQYFPFEGDPKADKYGIRQTPVGQYAIKYPVGVAILEMPFFLAAHAWCTVTQSHAADGFSTPYHIAIAWSSLLYALAGLWLLFLTARQFIATNSMAATGVTIVALGTHLFHYATAQAGMAHPYLFFLFAGFIYHVVKWRHKNKTSAAIISGLFLGLIAASRLPEVIAGLLLLPFLKNVGWVRVKQFIGCGLAALMAWFPQLWYQKMVSGHWWFNAYNGEQFDWAHPHIADGLFHYSNGWLVYTPVMVLGIAGLLLLRGKILKSFWPVYLILPIHIVICYSWWCWNYINGFGSRPMVEMGALLLFPLLSLLSAVWEKPWLKWIILGTAGICCALNIFQTWQQNEQIIWSERANQAYFVSTFGQTSRSEKALIALESNELQPDTNTLHPIKVLITDAAEDSTEERYRRTYAHSGQFSFRVNSEFAMGGPAFADTSGIRPGDYIRATVWSYVQPEERVREIDKIAKMVIDFNDGQGHVFKIPGITITSKTGNADWIPWHTGATGQWGQASFFARVPPEFPANGMIKAYIWNPGGQKFFADDFQVVLYRRLP